MKKLYIDCFSGISGNMFLGMLFDLGLDYKAWAQEMDRLGYPKELDLHYEKRNQKGIQGSFFDVFGTQKRFGQDSIMQEHHHHAAIHAHVHEHGDGLIHSHAHQHEDESLENHEHGHFHEHLHTHEHEHVHAHDHEYEHTHEHADHSHEHGEHSHRTYGEIVHILQHATLAPKVVEKVKAVFMALAEAEGAVHGKPWQEVGFHEVGNWDSIIDIVGVCVGLEQLGIEEIYVSDLTDGKGTVRCAHGLVPVPVPAVLKMLEGTAFHLQCVDVPFELLTPTGMAILKALAKPVKHCPSGKIIRSGYGFGSRETGRINAVRGTILETESQETKRIFEVSFMVDDIDPETQAFLQEKIRRLGALDAILWPVQGKKNRLGSRFEILVYEDLLPDLTRLLFAEAGTVGFRFREVQRQVMDRDFEEVNVDGHLVRLKHFTFEDIHKTTIEYDDLAHYAEDMNIPLEVARQRVWAAFHKE